MAQKDAAKRSGLPFCEKENRITEVLFHEIRGTNFIDDRCSLRGYCYPCFRKGIYHRAFYPGRSPPETHKVKCTWPFHHYVYYVDVTDDDFLKDGYPTQITEEEAKMLDRFIPDFEKEKGFYIFS